MLKKFILPAVMPSKKILSVDIGGSLAKTAFYVPKSDAVRLNSERFEKITHNTMPSKWRVR